MYHNNDTQSFGFATCRERWPKILSQAKSDVLAESTENEHSKQSTETIVKGIEQILDDIASDVPLRTFTKDELQAMGPDNQLEFFNEVIEGLAGDERKWLKGPWLFIECYLYRLLDVIIKTNGWTQFDIFERLKRETFMGSRGGVEEIALAHYKRSKETSVPTEEQMKLLFEEFIDISLWGNATDLSLLANATLEDIQSLQGAKARSAASDKILCNDLPKAWERLRAAKDGRIDIVLDNAGFEFYTDLALMLFLLDSELVKEVVFHCKCRPWMVSDTMIKDYALWVEDMKTMAETSSNKDALLHFVSSVEDYHSKGQFKLVDDEFWTGGMDYWNLSPKETKYGGKQLHEYLSQSTLVIFKGDLNYRKLTGDRMWDRSTPFNVAIGDLAHSGIPVLALRTCKADVCAGLPKGKDEELCKLWEEMGHEVGALWCSSGKWAVVSFNCS